MIVRIWHGWTNPEEANQYEYLLQEEIFPKIAAKNVEGYKSIKLLRRSLDDKVEFITIMKFSSWDSVKEFAGEDYKTAYVPEKARELLIKFDKESQHYEERESLDY